jgi:hypothetical protein
MGAERPPLSSGPHAGRFPLRCSRENRPPMSSQVRVPCAVKGQGGNDTATRYELPEDEGILLKGSGRKTPYGAGSNGSLRPEPRDPTSASAATAIAKPDPESSVGIKASRGLGLDLWNAVHRVIDVFIFPSVTRSCRFRIQQDQQSRTVRSRLRKSRSK